MKRNHKIFLIFLLIIVSGTGCIKDSLNIDPTRSNEENFDPNYLLTTAQMDYGNATEFQLYEMGGMVQIIASTLDYYSGGDKYSISLTSYNDRFFTNGLQGAARLLEAQKLAEKKDAAGNVNLIQIARIMWVMSMQRVTDIYGDIPYSEAGMAKYGIQYPKYDRQEDIYKDMLTRLEDAINKLDDTKPGPTGDIIYNGNIAQWKRLGYSLMLRIAMRVVKVDAALAKTYAEKAAGKTFTDINDNAILPLDGGSHEATQNRISNALLNDLPQVRWGATFINYLKNNNDPRLYTLTEKPDTGLAFNNQIGRGGLQYTKQANPPTGWVNEVPVGMPNGYTIGGVRDIATAPGYPGVTGTGPNVSPLGNYARPRLAVFVTKRSLSKYLITYAQTELLIAEAKLRGWDMGATTAEQHYKNGLTASLQSMQQLDGMLAISIPDITAFVDTRPLDISTNEKALEMINTEYWASTLFDLPEVWANYRRSGYPNLVAVNFPGNITNATIPRRLTYPLGENANNRDNYQSALQRMGGTDVNTTRTWWDK